MNGMEEFTGKKCGLYKFQSNTSHSGHAKLICCCSGGPGGKVGQVGRQNKTKKT